MVRDFQLDYVVVTGDLAAHDVWYELFVFCKLPFHMQYFRNYNNASHMAYIKNISDNIRRHELNFNIWHKTLYFANPVRTGFQTIICSAFPDIPVLFAIGNHEGLPVDMLTPHFAPKKWNEEWYCAKRHPFFIIFLPFFIFYLSFCLSYLEPPCSPRPFFLCVFDQTRDLRLCLFQK